MAQMCNQGSGALSSTALRMVPRNAEVLLLTAPNNGGHPSHSSIPGQAQVLRSLTSTLFLSRFLSGAVALDSSRMHQQHL